ncbi:MAG TPA: helix-turn-helix domain-containing protein [Polyangiaceae bacterium]|jgi:AcrR family transcriptional regulator
MATQKSERSARERLLDAANELFYAEGVHTVGIDRVIERAGVAKASLYGTFGSKDELVRAYLELRSATRRDRILGYIARYDDPRRKILGVFEYLAVRAAEPDWRGCAFVNATAEGPLEESAPRRVSLEARAWMRELFIGLAREMKLRDAEKVGRRLQVLWDGALIAASMERDLSVVEDARRMAEGLLGEKTAAGAETKGAAKGKRGK